MSDCFVCTRRISTSASGVGEIKPRATAVVCACMLAKDDSLLSATLKAHYDPREAR
jgi:hypothetical protein